MRGDSRPASTAYRATSVRRSARDQTAHSSPGSPARTARTWPSCCSTRATRSTGSSAGPRRSTGAGSTTSHQPRPAAPALRRPHRRRQPGQPGAQRSSRDEVYNLGAHEPRQGLLRDARVHRLDRRASARCGCSRRSAPPARLPLLPGLDLGDVRRDPAAAERGHAVPPALAVRRREALRALGDRQLPRGLRPVRGLRDPVQPRVPAPRRELRDPQDHPGGRGDRGRPPATLYLGNLDAVRDWGYAPEYVEGMWRMLQHDEPDDFVLATGEGHTVREFCEAAFAHAGLDWEDYVSYDERYERPDRGGRARSATRPRPSASSAGRPQTTAPDLARLMVDADIEQIDALPEALGVGAQVALALRQTGTAPSAARTCCLVGAPDARVTSSAVHVEHERRRGAQDAEPADQVEVVLGVDLDVGDAWSDRATSSRTRRVARHGAQNAEENCSSVARSPSCRRPRRAGQHRHRRPAAVAAPRTRWVPRNRPSSSARAEPDAERQDDGARRRRKAPCSCCGQPRCRWLIPPWTSARWPASRRRNLLPSPSVLSTLICPPCASTMARTMLRPRPARGCTAAWRAAPRKNGRNSRPSSSGATPIPMAATASSTAASRRHSRTEHRPTGLGVLHGVAQQVVHHLPQPSPVDAGDHGVLGHIDVGARPRRPARRSGSLLRPRRPGPPTSRLPV